MIEKYENNNKKIKTYTLKEEKKRNQRSKDARMSKWGMKYRKGGGERR